MPRYTRMFDAGGLIRTVLSEDGNDRPRINRRRSQARRPVTCSWNLPRPRRGLDLSRIFSADTDAPVTYELEYTDDGRLYATVHSRADGDGSDPNYQ